MAALETLAPLDADRKAVMAARIARRRARSENKQRIAFLDPNSVIPRTSIRVQDARDGRFEAVEVGLDARRVAPILEALARGALDALLL